MTPVTLLEFQDRIAKGKPVSGVLLLGSETYLRDQSRRAILDAFIPESDRQWGVSRMSANDESISAIIGQAQSMPMFAARQVIFVSDVEAWESIEEKSREIQIKDLTRYFDDPSPTTIIVFEAAVLDQRMRLAKTLSERVLVVSTELPEDATERARVAAPIARCMAKELGVGLDASAANELAEILNGSLEAIHTEIEKLVTYVGSGERITHEHITLLVIASQKYSVWELADMLAAREPERALRFMDSLLGDGEQPVALVGSFAWMYRKLLEAQELPPGISGGQAAGRLRMRANAAELAVRQCRKFPRARLVEGLEALYETDSLLKSGVANKRALMESLVVRLASPKTA